MLLINICVLVGAILTPPSLRWLYSTHIVLLCLYQLRVKNWQCLILIVISLVSLILNQVWLSPKNRVESESTVLWVKGEQCFITFTETPFSLVLLRSKSVSQYIKPCENAKPESNLGRPLKLIVSDLEGNRLQRYAYAKGVDAIAYIDNEHSLAAHGSLVDYFSLFPSWSYAYSVVKGDRSLWDERDRWLVNYLGVGHLFVVSGLHVGFVCALVFWLARWGWRFGLPNAWKRICHRRYIEFVLAGGGCVAYALWVGSGEPVVRAAMMAVVLLAARAHFYNITVMRSLLICAWSMLLIWPGRLLDPSFWLSFSFVFLLILLLHRVPKFGRSVYLQVLLTGFALLLTLGWQTSVSALVLLVNLLLIPFVALIWFPVTLFSLLEFSLLQQSYIYPVFDSVLVWVYAWGEPLLYSAPSLLLQSSTPPLIKLLCVVLAFCGVFCLPLLRGWLLVLVVVGSICIELKEESSRWVWQRVNDLVLESHEGDLIKVAERAQMGDTYLVVNPNAKGLAQRAIAENWEIALLNSGAKEAKLLEALSVKTVLIAEKERFLFNNFGDRWRVTSSNCYQILNLMKTVACEHAETLESVLN